MLTIIIVISLSPITWAAWKPCGVTSDVTTRKMATHSWYVNEDADQSDEGFRYFLHAYRQINAYILHQCALYCLRDYRCKSYNFLKQENLCELNDADRISDPPEAWLQHNGNWMPTLDGLIRHPGSRYLSKNALLLKKELNADYGPCSLAVCPENHICSPAPFEQASGNRGYQCQAKEYRLEEYKSEWTNWSSWSQCAETCGDGNKIRTRVCPNVNVNNTWVCPGESRNVLPCSLRNCPLWSHWGPWSDCGATLNCGSGYTRSRSRVCKWNALQNGISCPGNSVETQPCRLPSCQAFTRLTKGIRGYVITYDDRNMFNPSWLPVCKSQRGVNSWYYRSIEKVVCSSMGADRDLDVIVPDNETPSNNVSLDIDSCEDTSTHVIQCSTLGFNEDSCAEFLYVKCEERRKATSILTTLPPSYYVSGCEPSRCFTMHITYAINMSEILEIINSAVKCRQKITISCHGTLLSSVGALIARDGSVMNQWDQYCACSKTGTCVMPSRPCNCDSNMNHKFWDDIVITDKSKLPITAMQFGDTGSSSEYNYVTVGNVECFQN